MHKPKVSSLEPITARELPKIARRVAAPPPPPLDPDLEAASLSEDDVDAVDYIDETQGDPLLQTSHELRPLGARVGQGEVLALGDGRHTDTVPTLPMVPVAVRRR